MRNEFPHTALMNVSVVISKDGKDRGAHTDEDGRFVFRELTPGAYTVTVTHVGYEEISQEYYFDKGNNAVFFRLQKAVEQLDAAKISSGLTLMEERGDTLVINTRILDKKDTDSAKELLLQLPGMKISGNRVSFNGEKIARTYVNGTLVYGDIPTTAFTSLSATDVEELSVYHELSPVDKHRGLKNGRKEAVINVRTKEKIISAVDMDFFTAGGGVVSHYASEDPRVKYSGIHTGDFHSEQLQISERLSIDNISPGEIELTSKDATSRPSISKNVVAGDVSAGVQKNWGDRLFGNSVSFYTSYQASTSSQKSYETRNYHNYLGWDTLTQQDSIDRSESGRQAMLSSRLSLNGSKIKSLNLGVSGLIQMARTNAETVIHQVMDGLEHHGIQTLSDDKRGWNLSFDSRWSNNELKSYRPSLYLIVDTGVSHGDNSNTDTLKTSILRRDMAGEYETSHCSIQAGSSNEIVLRNTAGLSATLSIEYKFSLNRKAYQLYSWDFWPDKTAPVIDQNNSHDYLHYIAENSLSTGFSVYKGKLSFSGRGSAVVSQVKGNEYFPEKTGLNHAFYSLLPSVNLSIGSDFSLAFSTSHRIPSSDQLRGRVDDSSPYYVILGNPDLKRSYVPSLVLSWNHTYPKSASSVGVSFSSACELNSILTCITVEDGRIYSQAVNGGYNSNLSLDARYTKSYAAKRIMTSYFASGQYRSVPGCEYMDMVYLNSAGMRSGAEFSIRRKHLRMSSSASLAYSKAELTKETAYSYIQPAAALTGTFYAYKDRLLVSSRYNWSGTWFQNGDFIDFSSHFLSLELGVWAVKTKLYISLSGHDLFNGDPHVNYVFSPNYIDQNWNGKHGSYFMLNARYIFKTKR